MIRNRIPLLCLICGNAVLTMRNMDYEKGLRAVCQHGCPVCDPHAEDNEQFYLTCDDRILAFGELWKDHNCPLISPCRTPQECEAEGCREVKRRLWGEDIL